MKLTISRRTWLRGDDSRASHLSQLYEQDGRSCCLGHFIAASIGIRRECLRGKSSPEDCVDGEFVQTAGHVPRWLLCNGMTGNSLAADRLMEANDLLLSDGSREETIAVEFARHDVEVTFVD